MKAIEMTTLVHNVFCPCCGSAHVSKVKSEVLDDGGYTAVYADTWQCWDCDSSFGITCQRILSTYMYSGEFEDDIDYKIDWD